MNATVRLCENLINKGRTQGMLEKLDQLLLFGQITAEEFARLMELLKTKEQVE